MVAVAGDAGPAASAAGTWMAEDYRRAVTDTDETPRRDRREHGGGPSHPDDDALAERTEQERAEAGLVDYDEYEVPPATDDPVPTPITESEQYQEELAEIRRQAKEGELVLEDSDQQVPPTRYDRD